jgi:hypothetical protein
MFLAIAHLVAAVEPSTASSIKYAEVARESGIDFHHVNGASGQKYYIETMGSGACWFDYDNDGDLDLYVVNSAELPGFTAERKPSSHLYRNEGKGRFTDVTAEAGVGNTGYGMGCVAGDIDGDGDLDLYVTNFGANVLYRNLGDGKFLDVTAEAGVAGGGWSASAAFADIDNDGDLDLYVTRYIDFTPENNKYCGLVKPGYRAYCHPDEYNGVADLLFRNKGDGHFEDVSKTAGIANPIGKGLGVVFTDVNDDGWPDIYVANDKTINFLYLNQKDGTFKDISVLSGTGFSESGEVQAGMGTDSQDVNGDGRMDLVVTNLDYETNELYINNGDLTFTDATFKSGLAEPSFLRVGFGVSFLDFDNDGDLDLLVANGHIIDNIELTSTEVTYLQPRSLLENDGKAHFHEIGPSFGARFVAPEAGRGLAVADFDNDGDLDFFVVNNNRQAQLFRNDGGDRAGHWLTLKLRGTRSNRDGVGARVRVRSRDATGGARWQTSEVREGSSYLSQSDIRLHFGLGATATAEEIEIRWPSGIRQSLKDVKADQFLDVIETPSHP